MGFDPVTIGIISAGATLASKAVEAEGEHQQSKAYRRAADITALNAQRRAAATKETAMENQRREQRNARMQLARARAEAGASNLLADGTVAVRELDLATRLEDEINNRTDAALREATETEQQGAMDSWNLRLQARNARRSMLGTALSAAGGLTNDLFGRNGIRPGGFSSSGGAD